jgi:hypothetical protein
MIKQKVLIYCAKADGFKYLDWPTGTQVFYANPRYFRNPENGYNSIWTNREDIKKAYAQLGVGVVTLPGETDPVEEEAEIIEFSFDEDSFVVSQVDESGEAVSEEEEDLRDDDTDDFDYNWRELPWWTLRAEAAKFAGGSVRDKKMAYEVMEAEEAKRKGE